jgi:hypothetical protein
MRPTFLTRAALVLTLSLSLAACASNASSPATDVANAVDAGSTPTVTDSGTATADAGVTTADAGTSADAGPTQPQWTLRLTVPRNYSGTPRQMSVVLVNSLPVVTIPAAFLTTKDNPTVAAGQEITLSGPVPTNRGPFKILAVLYMQGGGQFSPKPGTDYDAASPADVTLTGSSVDFGTMPLALHSATDGHSAF